MALRLSKALGTSPEFWYGMQVNYDLWQPDRHGLTAATGSRRFADRKPLCGYRLFLPGIYTLIFIQHWRSVIGGTPHSHSIVAELPNWLQRFGIAPRVAPGFSVHPPRVRTECCGQADARTASSTSIGLRAYDIGSEVHFGVAHAMGQQLLAHLSRCHQSADKNVSASQRQTSASQTGGTRSRRG